MTKLLRYGRLVVVALMAPLLLAPGAAAQLGSLSAFLDEVDQAYAGYKMAWFYTRGADNEIAAIELDGFREAWAAIVARYRATAPGPFANDPQWAATLDRIGTIAGHAAAELSAGKPRAAHETLGPIRQELAALRDRAGITVFSDVVDAYGREVETLSALGRRIEAMTPEVTAELRAIAARIRSLLHRIRSQRPPRYASDAGFDASVDGNFASLAKLDRGIAAGHLEAVKGSIRSVRADYVLLFIRYG